MKTSGVLDYRNKEVREGPGRQRSRRRRAGPEKRMTPCKGGTAGPIRRLSGIYLPHSMRGIGTGCRI